jgi:hypothetical protein
MDFVFQLDVGFFSWLFLSDGFCFSIGCWFFHLAFSFGWISFFNRMLVLSIGFG